MKHHGVAVAAVRVEYTANNDDGNIARAVGVVEKAWLSGASEMAANVTRAVRGSISIVVVIIVSLIHNGGGWRN